MVRLRDRWALVFPDLVRKARERVLKPLTAVEALGAALTGQARVDEDWVPVTGEPLDLLRQRLDVPDDIPQPASLAATLQDYQLRGLRWLARMTELGLGGGTSWSGRSRKARHCRCSCCHSEPRGPRLNLTRADHVVHYDRWWNPAVEAQATDRAHRIGQDRPVQVHRLIAEGTVEDRIAALLESKKELSDAVLGQQFTELTDADLAELVELRGLP